MTSAVRTFLQLGRNGDIINILPALRGEFMRTGQPTNLVVDVSYAPLLDGCSYVNVIASPYQDFAGVQQAARWARRIGYNPLTITQVHGRGWSIERSAPCFAEDSRRLCQVPDTDWREPVIFDKRSPEREKRLIDRLPEGPIVLFNGASRSAPFSDMESFRDELRILCESNGATVFDITDTKAERLYDLLGLYERAALLVTVDTATLHLAAATPQLPVISLLPGREDKWHFAWMPLPTVNVKLAVPYPKWSGMMPEIEAAIQSALSNGEETAKLAASVVTMKEVLGARAREGAVSWDKIICGHGIDLWPKEEDAIQGATVFQHGAPASTDVCSMFPPSMFDFVHYRQSAKDKTPDITRWLPLLKKNGHLVALLREKIDLKTLESVGDVIVKLRREAHGMHEIVLQRSSENPFTADYYLNGTATGLSNYDDYRWLPELTIPVCKRMMHLLGAKKKDSVLDYGCARGYYVKALRELGYDALGYDISEWAIENCDESVKPFVDTSWPIFHQDWVIAKDVLEHVKASELSATIDTLIQHAKKGVLIIVPLAGADGKFVSPRDRADITHVNCWHFEKWLGELQAAADKTGEEMIVSGGFKLPGVKSAADEWPRSCGFFTIKRIK